jgi:hypothetical protein
LSYHYGQSLKACDNITAANFERFKHSPHRTSPTIDGLVPAALQSKPSMVGRLRLQRNSLLHQVVVENFYQDGEAQDGLQTITRSPRLKSWFRRSPIPATGAT